MPQVAFKKAGTAKPGILGGLAKNTSGSDRAKGDWAIFDPANTDTDTFAVTRPVAGELDRVVGVWAEAVPNNAMGVLWRGGYIPEAKVMGSASVLRGVRLALVAGQSYAAYDASADDTITAMETYTTAAVALKPVFLRGKLY